VTLKGRSMTFDRPQTLLVVAMRDCKVVFTETENQVTQSFSKPNKWSKKTQSNLTTGSFTHANVWFNGIRQVVPVCSPTEYMLPWAHWSPNPKRHLDQLSRFCAGPCSVPTLYNFPPLPLKIAHSYGIWTASKKWFLGLPKSSTQTAFWLIQPFLQGSLLWRDRSRDNASAYIVLRCGLKTVFSLYAKGRFWFQILTWRCLIAS